MYTDTNFKTKKEFLNAFHSGQKIHAYQPGGFFASQTVGPAALEGPHYPAAHTWYASVTLEDGYVVRVGGKAPDPSKVVPPKEMKQPSFATLQRWSNDGVAKATDGCTVEPDGHCPHGKPSWVLKAGLI